MIKYPTVVQVFFMMFWPIPETLSFTVKAIGTDDVKLSDLKVEGRSEWMVTDEPNLRLLWHPWHIYRFTGNKRSLELHYNSMSPWTKHLRNKVTNDLVWSGSPQGLALTSANYRIVTQMQEIKN